MAWSAKDEGGSEGHPVTGWIEGVIVPHAKAGRLPSGLSARERLSNRLVLSSLKAITKEPSPMARRLGRPSPDPGLGPGIELCCGDTPGLIDFTWVGKVLSCQRIAAEESPPALLQI